ncbi:MAG: uncharacterized protein A8A55_0224 [Amphiamblys sp. WSBS2006]|nr:MAG: uncharacterized protein A8A55_0224 [Amphiamblys sp. WSBS2006]
MVFVIWDSDVCKRRIYIGEDKYENDELIKHGVKEDVWFHVDRLSSAHVYIALERGETAGDLNKQEVELCAQLAKNSSIEGRKKHRVDVVYTEWSNLKKERGHAPGEVSFHDRAVVKKVSVEGKDSSVLNRADKRKKRVSTDEHVAVQTAKIKEENRERRERDAAERKDEEEKTAKSREEKKQRSYEDVFDEGKMKTNKLGLGKEEYEDSFFG